MVNSGSYEIRLAGGNGAAKQIDDASGDCSKSVVSGGAVSSAQLLRPTINLSNSDGIQTAAPYS